MNDMDRQLKELKEQMEKDSAVSKQKSRAKATSMRVTKKSYPIAELLIGLVLLGVGIYWVLNSFVVSFSWGSLWGGWGVNVQLATGLMLVPLLIGIGLAFFVEHKWIAGVVIAIGLLIILVTLLTSVRFRPVSASLWQYVLMFGMIAAGLGLSAKALLKRGN